MRVPVSIRTSYFMADKKALVDSGATDNFMHPAFAKRMGLGLQELPTPKKIFNIDNTSNKSGMITHFLDLNVQTNGINKEMRFLVTDIGHEEILLGYPWLVSRFPLALSPKMKKTRSCTSCEGTHVTSGVNTRQTPSGLTGIRTMKTTAWQLDA
jgi:hypothetical protein